MDKLQPYQQEILGDFVTNTTNNNINANNSVFDLDSLKELYNSLKRKCSICELPFSDSQIFEINNEYNCINCWEQLNEMSPQKSPRPKTIERLKFEKEMEYVKTDMTVCSSLCDAYDSYTYKKLDKYKNFIDTAYLIKK